MLEAPAASITAARKWLLDNVAHQLDITASDQLHNLDVLAVVSESDTGLRVAEQFANDLGLCTSNGINEGRRDKYIMQEQLKIHFSAKEKSSSSSQPAPPYIRQILTDDWKEAKAFLQNLSVARQADPDSFPDACVIKPSRGAASVGVSKATNWKDAEAQFRSLLGTPGYANGQWV